MTGRYPISPYSATFCCHPSAPMSQPRDGNNEFFKLLLKFERQDYGKIREECLRKGVLFEDHLFEAKLSSYYLPSEMRRLQGKSNSRLNIAWLRPKQIASSPPRFLHTAKSFSTAKNAPENSAKSATRDYRNQFYIARGRYGCANFISALPILFWNEDTWGRVVPEDQSFEGEEYAGIFHFRIWQYGKWYDIVVDDRLPTLNGKPIQVHTSGNIEWWPSLLEKAFAKLNGCYQSLHGCAIGEFLEDLTGDLCESISSDIAKELNESLFEILRHSMKLNSHVVVQVSHEKRTSSKSGKCAQRHNCAKQQLTNGLIKNQSYLVLEAKLLDHLGSQDKTVHLIKLCNPWKRMNEIVFGAKANENKASTQTLPGIWSDGKWVGSWSERSPEWVNLSDELKGQYDLLLENDSLFWMPIECFVDTFTDVNICHSTTRPLVPHKASKNWNTSFFHGFWISGFSAGGCFNETTFHQNPAYLLSIYGEKSSEKSSKMCESSASVSKSKSNLSPVETTGTGKHTVLIGLMQKYRNSKRTSGMHDLKIGFNIFKLEQADLRYIEEVIYDENGEKARLKMKAEYFQATKDEYGIKLFSNLREVSERYTISEGNYLVVPSTYGPNCDGNFLLRMLSEVPFKRDIFCLQPDIRISKNHFYDRMFSRPLASISALEEHVDPEHLEVLLRSVTTLGRNCFSLEQCQSLMGIYDINYAGTLSYSQIQRMCMDIDSCYLLFLRNDKTLSRSISLVELKTSLLEVGIDINATFLEILMNRFATRIDILVMGKAKRELKFPNFAICVLKLCKALTVWKTKDRITGMSMLEFVRQVVYS